MTKRNRTALVLGATGGIGGATAAVLLWHGWSVVAMSRSLPENLGSACPGDPRSQMRWVVGDAMNLEDVARAAEGCDVIIHAVNPPGYRDWDKVVLPMIDNTITAARLVGARIVLPGTIYNYGPDAFPILVEDSPQHPITMKGRIRVQLERRLEDAASSGVPALIVRFGDFFGPEAKNNWFGQGLVQPNRRLASITAPGRPGIGHSWAYLPDAGETIARLLDRADQLEPFARFHFEGVWDSDGSAMMRAISRVAGRPDLPIKPLPWWLLRIAGLFQQTPREIVEMRYLWQSPIRLCNRRLVAFLGEEPRTQLDRAVAATLESLNVQL